MRSRARSEAWRDGEATDPAIDDETRAAFGDHGRHSPALRIGRSLRIHPVRDRRAGRRGQRRWFVPTGRLAEPHGDDQSFRGRYLLVFFGYTGCPDICPTTLAAVTQALRLLGAQAADVQPIFITVDPEHDTPNVMRTYIAAFAPRLIGLTGTPSELEAAEKAYHVTVEMTATGIDHSAVLYLMAPDGHFLAPLPANGSAAVLAADLSHDLT